MAAHRFNVRSLASHSGWLVLALACGAYGVFAFTAGLGLVEIEKVRVSPVAFAIHALAGSLTLIAGAVQVYPNISARLPWAHRSSGRVYVTAVSLASSSGALNAALFDVSMAARLSFVLLAALWFLVTWLGYGMIRAGHMARHREWMLRSFSLSLFFVSFSFWVPALARSGLAAETSYALAVNTSWAVNLVIAEIWIRRARAGATRAPKSLQASTGRN